MKKFDVIANIGAGCILWSLVTAVPLFLMTWGGDANHVLTPGTEGIALLIVLGSFTSFVAYAQRYWKKLER